MVACQLMGELFAKTKDTSSAGLCSVFGRLYCLFFKRVEAMCSLNPNFGKILEKLMKKNLLLTLGLVTTMAAVGCTDASTDGPVTPSSGEYGSRGLALTTDFLGNTDVVGMRYEISKCDDGLVHTADRKLEDLLLPGMIPAFENKPFDEDSQHIFAD